MANIPKTPPQFLEVGGVFGITIGFRLFVGIYEKES